MTAEKKEFSRVIDEILPQLSLEEKAGLCTGKNFWFMKGLENHGIPETAMNDGPHGLRKQEGEADNLGIAASVPATCFPTAVTLASSWDRDLLHEVGSAIAEECLEENVSIVLGPGINIKRHPLCGRNFEYYSEDPFLSGELGASFINGVQEKGIGTSLKHFAVNNQEYHRMVTDVVVDERTLREIYLTGFEISVKKSQPWTVMAAYNRLNGTYCCDYKKLLTGILREEWGFDGIVVSDWGATNDRAAGIAAGMDLEMPGTADENTKNIISAVKEGTLKEEDLNRVVSRLLATAMKAQKNRKKSFTFDKTAHHALARRAAAESAVLLKNESNILPLKTDVALAVIGDMARNPRYQGNGSSLINPLLLENAFDEISKIHTVPQKRYYAQGYRSDTEEIDEGLISEAVETALRSETVVIFAGLPPIFESEGFDREHMRMPANQLRLIDEISAIHDRVIIVLSNGSPIEMPWLNRVKGVIEAYLGGEASGGAAADIIFGRVNPGGKLAETFPLRLEDCASHSYFPGKPRQVQYREGLFVGYRYFDSVSQEVLFPFGYGLSYTSFKYSEMKLSEEKINSGQTVRVSCNITNTGDIAGHEITQLYVHHRESSVYRPEQELKGFTRIFLEAGASREITFELDKRAFAFYDTKTEDWQVDGGSFEIRIGASSRDIRLKQVFTVNSDFVPETDSAPKIYHSPSLPFQVSAEDFTALLGHAVPDVEPVKPFHLNSTIGETGTKFLGRVLYKQVLKEATKMMGDEMDDTTRKIIESGVGETPLRSIVLMSGGQFSFKLVEVIIHFLNGKILKGLGRLLR